MGCSWSALSLRVVFLASLLLLSSALLTPPAPPSGGGSGSPTEVAADEALLARMCDRRPAGVPRSWCHELHYHLRRRGGSGGVHHNRHHHHHSRPVPLPPPGRDGGGAEEIDPRYGVSKRLVPTGPNPLHN